MTTTIIVAIVAVVVALLIAVPVTCKVAVNNKIQKDAEIVGTAEDKARSIIDEALKTAETKKREALLEVKEESLRTKNELEKETKERRNELQKYENRVLAKESAVDKKADAVEKREAECTARAAEVQKKEKRVEELEQKGVQELERVSGLTSEQAKEELLRSVEDDVKVDVARLYRELESRAKEEAGKKAKEYVVNAIQKCAVDHVAETTISVVQLPSDEMKGRIIGREGRNIRTLETLTGVDLIIDDTPEAVVLSAFDPIRREVARVALEKLIVDGRIHPARIEEMVETYYNSRQFCYTLPYLIRHFKRPFTLFEKLAEYYEENGLDTLSHARTARYEILYDFARFYDAERCEAYKQLLTLDFYLRENAKSRPLFAGDERISKEEFRLFYDREDEERRYLENYENMEKRQLRKMTHIERFSYDVLGNMKEEECVLLFDYQNRNPLDHQAKVFCVTEEIRELCKQ